MSGLVIKKSSGRNTADARGDVRVQFQLLDPETGNPMKGNLSKSMKLEGVTVTEAHDAIEGLIEASAE